MALEAEELITRQCLRAELALLRTEFAEALHRQTVWHSGAIAGSTALVLAASLLT